MISVPSLVLLTSTFVAAQLPLPQPPFLPPDAAYGSHPSSAQSSGSANPHWSTLLGNLLYFYEAQRSGKLPSTNRVFWRNSSTLDDGKDAGLDLTGGYFDAGNFIKATFPLSATITSICWGALDHGKGYDLANQTTYLDDMLRWSLDWMMKAHPGNNTLYVLVGTTDSDNWYWGGDQDIPSFRPSFQVNDTHPGTDAAAGASAAFSTCSLLYSGRSFGGPFSAPASLQNSSYADLLGTHAKQLYSFAVNASGGQMVYQASVPAVADAYPSSGYKDHLTLATLLLSYVTNSTSLYQTAEEYYTQFQLGGQDDVYNWDSSTPAIPVLFSQIAQSPSNLGGKLNNWQTEAERYFDNIINRKSRAWLTKGGLLWYDGDSDEASLNPALNAAMLMIRYAQIASTEEKKNSYLNFAQSQLDYALGKNPMSVPYIVGTHPNSPQNPHSSLASGGDSNHSIDTYPEKEAHVLYGGVIGGPDKYDRYFDIRSDWPEAECALDYNAPMLTLAAMYALNDTGDPFYTSVEVGAYEQVKPSGFPCDPAFPCKPRLSKAKTVAIAVLVSIVGLVISGLLAGYIWRLVCSKKDIKVDGMT